MDHNIGILYLGDKLNENGGDVLVDEVSWFNKISWNLALSCGEKHAEMQQAFLLCYQVNLRLWPMVDLVAVISALLFFMF